LIWYFPIAGFELGASWLKGDLILPDSRVWTWWFLIAGLTWRFFIIIGLIFSFENFLIIGFSLLSFLIIGFNWYFLIVGFELGFLAIKDYFFVNSDSSKSRWISIRIFLKNSKTYMQWFGVRWHACILTWFEM